jgi:hypothetical protein
VLDVGPAERLRKPGSRERQDWKLVRHVESVLALKGKKPRENLGSQPGKVFRLIPEVH